MKSCLILPHLLTLSVLTLVTAFPPLGQAADRDSSSLPLLAASDKRKDTESTDKKAVARRPVSASKLKEQLTLAQRDLEQARDSVHEAQKELAAKAESISTLQSQVDSLNKQLAAAQNELKKLHGTAGALTAEKKKSATLLDSLKELQQKASLALTKAEADPAPLPAIPAEAWFVISLHLL